MAEEAGDFSLGKKKSHEMAPHPSAPNHQLHGEAGRAAGWLGGGESCGFLWIHFFFQQLLEIQVKSFPKLLMSHFCRTEGQEPRVERAGVPDRTWEPHCAGSAHEITPESQEERKKKQNKTQKDKKGLEKAEHLGGFISKMEMEETGTGVSVPHKFGLVMHRVPLLLVQFQTIKH